MAKFEEFLKRTLQGEPARMGFGVAVARPKTTALALIVGVASAAKDLASMEAQAPQAVLFQGEEIAEAPSGIVRGVVLPQATRESADQAREKGADFIVAPLRDVGATALLVEEIDVVVRVESDLPEMSLRLLGRLPIAALLWQPDDPSWSPPTIERLLACQRIGDLSGKPLLVQVSLDSTLDELKVLRLIGVAGVFAEVKSDADQERLAALRERLEQVPRQVRAVRRSYDVTIPAPVVPVAPEEPEEDE